MRYLFLLLIPIFAFAQDVVPVPPSGDEVTGFFASLMTLKGAGGMAIAMAVVQGLLLVFRSSLGKIAGAWQLLIVSSLSLAAMVLVDLVSGKGLGGLFSDVGVVAAIQVYIHQIINQVQKLPQDQAMAPNETKTAPPAPPAPPAA